jgi:hypothetical protein
MIFDGFDGGCLEPKGRNPDILPLIKEGAEAPLLALKEQT